MASKLKKTVFTILPIAFGIFIIWYFLKELTPDDKKAIITSFKTANYWWVALSLFFGVLSHFSRAYRWKYMLEPLGYTPKLLNLVMAVLVTYIVNLAIPRAGEIARATTLTKFEKVPFEKALGTIVSERIADAIMLLSIVGLAFLLQGNLIKSYLFDENSNPYESIIKLAVFCGVFLIGYFFIRKSRHPFALKIRNFFSGLVDGVKSILTMKKKGAFIFHTVFIWLMYVLMFYAVTFALPETTNLPFGAIIVGFVVGGISMAVSNGGLGVYPVAVASALILYNIDENPARAFGWIMWTAQTLMILFFGGLSFLCLPLYNKEK